MLKARRSGDQGQPTIVFLHAIGTSGWMWEDFFARLTGFRCIAVDLPGHGESRSVPWRSMGDTADQLAEFIRQETGGKAHVVGLSVGSYVGLTLLSRHPALVDRCVLSGLNVLPLPNKWLMTAMGLVLAPLLKTRLAAQMNARALGIPPRHLEGYRNSLRQVSLRSYMAASRDAGNFGMPPNAREILNPTLLLAGEREHPLIHRSMGSLADTLPNAIKRLVPAGGHGWPGEFPELFVETVKAWCLYGSVPNSLQEPQASQPSKEEAMPQEIKPDIAAALRGNPHAQSEWQRLSAEQHAEKLAWVEGAESPEARMRRLSLLIEQLTQPG